MNADGSRGLWKPPIWISFGWGLLEATVFFLIPDIVLSWAALAGARCGIKSLVAILAGSLLGGAVMFQWATFAPEASRAMVERVPFVRASMFEKVQADYASHGLPAMLRGPNSGIPYKVYAVLAPRIGGMPTFLLLSIPARLERIALSWLGFTIIGWLFRRPINSHKVLTTVAFLVFWSGIYAIYWNRI